MENQIQDNELMGDFEQEMIEERIGKLKGGLCIVKAGGHSEVEVSEQRDRIEDALCSVKAGIEDGYVVGAGLGLYLASKKLDDSNLPHEE